MATSQYSCCYSTSSIGSIFETILFFDFFSDLIPVLRLFFYCIKKLNFSVNPIPPDRATFNFLSSWQFFVFLLDFLGEFVKFILVLDFNWKSSKNLKIFWAWLISQTPPKNEKKIFFNFQNKLHITFRVDWSFIELI